MEHGAAIRRNSHWTDRPEAASRGLPRRCAGIEVQRLRTGAKGIDDKGIGAIAVLPLVVAK